MDVRMLTVGPLQENCFIAGAADTGRAIVVDPGEEPERILATLADAGLRAEAILLTHTHFDHVGAVAAVARATGAPVYVPELEREVLANINDYVGFPGFGPFEPWEAEHTVAGGDTLELAGLRIDVLFVPGHSPGHVAYSVADERILFSGDVLFESSIGRTDLPGGDMATLMRSISMLLETLPGQTTVAPGHMRPTTLERERQTNPFLQELV
jgi:glyoxylase-like metal-dependent hydrolase (beta-lactamase superfamily II)